VSASTQRAVVEGIGLEYDTVYTTSYCIQKRAGRQLSLHTESKGKFKRWWWWWWWWW